MIEAALFESFLFPVSKALCMAKKAACFVEVLCTQTWLVFLRGRIPTCICTRLRSYKTHTHTTYNSCTYQRPPDRIWCVWCFFFFTHQVCWLGLCDIRFDRTCAWKYFIASCFSYRKKMRSRCSAYARTLESALRVNDIPMETTLFW